MRGMSLCKRCVVEKAKIEDSYLPCLEHGKSLTSEKPEGIRELLCQVGPYQWCTKFCNMSDLRLELRFEKEFARIVSIVEPLWVASKP